MSKHQSISQKIYSDLRMKIIMGILKPRERLRELEVAQNYHSSQAPVREAFQKLQEQGLVETIRYTGTFVSEISDETIKNLFELRALIEKNTIRKALYVMQNSHIQELEKIKEEMLSASIKGNIFQLIHWDMEFHQYIIQLSNNQTMMLIWNLLDAQISRFLMISHPMFFSDLNEVAEQHNILLDAILTKNIDLVEQAFEQHTYLSLEKIYAIQKQFGI
jgi:DNA-binding GntR family transcriptional regulator